MGDTWTGLELQHCTYFPQTGNSKITRTKNPLLSLSKQFPSRNASSTGLRSAALTSAQSKLLMSWPLSQPHWVSFGSCLDVRREEQVPAVTSHRSRWRPRCPIGQIVNGSGNIFQSPPITRPPPRRRGRGVMLLLPPSFAPVPTYSVCLQNEQICRNERRGTISQLPSLVKSPPDRLAPSGFHY